MHHFFIIWITIFHTLCRVWSGHVFSRGHPWWHHACCVSRGIYWRPWRSSTGKGHHQDTFGASGHVRSLRMAHGRTREQLSLWTCWQFNNEQLGFGFSNNKTMHHTISCEQRFRRWTVKQGHPRQPPISGQKPLIRAFCVLIVIIWFQFLPDSMHPAIHQDSRFSPTDWSKLKVRMNRDYVVSGLPKILDNDNNVWQDISRQPTFFDLYPTTLTLWPGFAKTTGVCFYIILPQAFQLS